jgi:acetyl esterase/lipase
MTDSTQTAATSAMALEPVDLVIERVRKVYRSWNRATTVQQMRSDWDALFWSDAVSALCEPVRVGDVDASWIVTPGSHDDAVLMYFHGGGFQVGSTRSHRDLIARLSLATGCKALGVDYRLAPEHRFPAAVHDACGAYEWLLSRGVEPKRIVFAGDSAGGGIAVSAMLVLRDLGKPLPAATVLMSPWTDLTASGESYDTRAQQDPIHQRPMILAMAKSYLGDAADAREPIASPLFADLRGLPPMLIQVGDRETVLDDSRAFAQKAKAADVEVELEVWDNMIHVFQQFPLELSEARQAIESIGRFVRKHIPRNT